jgi:hypothetical protein
VFGKKMREQTVHGDAGRTRRHAPLSRAQKGRLLRDGQLTVKLRARARPRQPPVRHQGAFQHQKDALQG